MMASSETCKHKHSEPAVLRFTGDGWAASYLQLLMKHTPSNNKGFS
jgi:hypothetical protein